MSDLPTGPIGDGTEDEGPQGANPFSGTPFEQLFSGLARGDMSSLQAMFGQLQRMFTPHEGAVNWEFTKDLARQVVARSPDPSVDQGARSRLGDVAQLAEHWLDAVTDLPASSTAVTAWSRAEWVEASLPAWQQLVEPVAANVVRAMGEAIPGEAAAMAGPMLGMLNQLGSAMFSQQLGQAIGELAGEVVSASDVGFPVAAVGVPAIVITNAEAFGEGLGLEDSDVLLYLVLRECAAQRLYVRAEWLRPYVFSLIEQYGRGISIDTDRIEQTIGSIDPTNVEALQEALGGGLFDVEQSPAQRAALERLETVLALVEGWVDDVVAQAASAMPQAAALREAVRRRRATGGPAEATFAALVGLELRPRRLRDAAALWGALRSAEGAAARDAVWAHQELLPTAADLDDPLAYAERTREADDLDVDSPEFDAALAALLDEAPGQTFDQGSGATPDGPDDAPEPDEATGPAEPDAPTS